MKKNNLNMKFLKISSVWAQQMSVQLNEIPSNLDHQDKHLPTVLPTATARRSVVMSCAEGNRKG